MKERIHEEGKVTAMTTKLQWNQYIQEKLQVQRETKNIYNGHLYLT